LWQKWQESEFLVGLLQNCTFVVDPSALCTLKYNEIGGNLHSYRRRWLVLGDVMMRKTLVVALAVTSLVTAAKAADVAPASPVPFYDPLPDSLSWHGITFYANVDVGYAYQTNGRPTGAVVSTLEYSPFTTTRNYTGQAISTIAANGLQQSNFGIRIDTPIGRDWSIVGRLDSGFDPLTGSLANGCQSFINNAGLNYAAQNSNADSGRCGQFFNGPAYGGISNPLFGTLTIGRQQSLQLDELAVYDPMALSYAFSLLGYSGTFGGSGSTQASRWDNSAKYVYQYGPVHAAAEYGMGSNQSGMFNDAFSFNVGGTYGGFSIDGVYTKERGVVNLQTAVNDVVGATTLAANISDNTAYSVMAKYTWNLGGGGSASPYPTKAAVKAPAVDKFTIFAGYEHIENANPNSPVTSGSAAGNFVLTSGGGLPDNNAFTTARIFDTYWVGGKYAFAWGLNLVGAYYHVNQNSYVADSAPCVAGGASKNDCAGTYDQVSFLVDYDVTKHLDVYTGITYARVTNGLASSFPGTPGAKFGLAGTNTSVDTATWMTGFRVKI
jgi:predicted porin